jgi:zinc transport system substrate-binding protein
MKKYILFLFSACLFFSCGQTPKNDGKTLTVTIAPQRFFLEKLVGDSYQINTLVPPATSPETYEPSPATMIELGKSRIYFKVGFLGFENAWAQKLKENNPGTTIVDCSQGVDLMHDEHEHSEQGADPHIWTSPKNALVLSKNMLNALVELNPENKDSLQANYEKLAGKIEATDSIIRQKLADVPSRRFIIYHPALSYFARDYGLEQYSIEFEGKNPSPVQIKDIVDLATANRIKTVFVQAGFDTKNAEVIAQEAGAKVYPINPLSAEWDKELLRIADILAGGGDE